MTGKSRFLAQGLLTVAIVGIFLAYGLLSFESAETGVIDDRQDGGAAPTGIDNASEYDSEGVAPLSIEDGEIPWQLGLGVFILGSCTAMAVLFARLSSDDVLEGVRKDIYEHIEQNPGEHLAGITRRFGISSSSVRHHLDVLEWSELIVSHKGEKMRHYYPNRNGYRIYTNGQGYKEILAAMRNQTARDIVKLLMAGDKANQKEIAEALGLHPSTVNWHANRLLAVDIITKTREGKDIRYHLNPGLDMAKVISLIEGDMIVLDAQAAVAESASS